jgi:hypothetical protein
MAVQWGERWKVLPDDERQQWMLDPFVSVGPLRFDMSPSEVSQALSSVTGDFQLRPHRPYIAEAVSGCTVEIYRESGLHLYYREQRLDGVVVSARLGPQVLADGVALVGQVPSVLEQWMLDRAEARQDSIRLLRNGGQHHLAPPRPRMVSLQPVLAGRAAIRRQRGRDQDAPLPPSARRTDAPPWQMH